MCKLCRFAGGICQVGFRKNHERSDPQCRLHGVTGRGSGARPSKADTSPKGGGHDPSSTTEPKKVLLKTRRGLHLQFDPEPSLDQWISSEVQFSVKTGKYMTPGGSSMQPSKLHMNNTKAGIGLAAGWGTSRTSSPASLISTCRKLPTRTESSSCGSRTRPPSC